jgi:hypothetical protein
MDREYGTCDICGREAGLGRKYYYYDISCECCVGSQHFELVRYCNQCTPVPPARVKVIIQPIKGR